MKDYRRPVAPTQGPLQYTRQGYQTSTPIPWRPQAINRIMTMFVIGLSIGGIALVHWLWDLGVG